MSNQGEVEQVIAELQSLDLEQMTNALLLVRELDDVRIADAMLEVLPRLRMRPGEGYVAAQILGELGAREDRRVVSEILRLLEEDLDNGDDHQLESLSCQILANLGATEALPLLRSALGSTRWDYLEDDLADAIARIGGAGEIDFLVGKLGAREPRVQIAVLGALAQLRAVGAASAIERLANAKDPEVRQAALAALVAVQPERAGDLLGALLAAATTTVARDFALREIVARRVTGLVPELLARLERADHLWERFALIDALVGLGEPRGRAELDRLHSDRASSPWTRAAAAARLVRLGRTELVQPLLEVLRAFPAYDEKVDTWNWSIDAARATIDALLEATASAPRQRLELVEILDAIRRERIKIAQGLVRQRASEIVREIVGSDMFADCDAWVARARARGSYG